MQNLKLEINAELLLKPEKVICTAYKSQDMNAAKYHRNDLLNFCVIHNVKNEESIKTFRIGQKQRLV